MCVIDQSALCRVDTVHVQEKYLLDLHLIVKLLHVCIVHLHWKYIDK